MKRNRPNRSSTPPASSKFNYHQALRQAGGALAIPSLLLAGPLVGYGLAWAAIEYLGAPDWLLPLGVVFGVTSGIYESVRVIQKLSQESDRDTHG